MSPVVLSIGRIQDLLQRRNRALERAGFEVITASSGDEAIGRCAGNRVDVVVFGHAIPEDERNAAAETIRSLHPHARIIFLHNGRANDTELADAVIHVNGEQESLPLTVDFLLMRKKTSAGEITR